MQCTVANRVSAAGVGLHSGVPIYMTFMPAPPDTGIVFRRVDCRPVKEIPANMAFISDTRMCTTIERHGARVATVEHLLSAIAGVGIDNLYVDLNGPEVPIMDGSASPFVFILQSAGISWQKVPKKIIRVTEPVMVSDEKGVYCRLLPDEGRKIEFCIDFDHPAFSDKTQRASIDLERESYFIDVSRARTFGFVSQLDMLKKQNLALGASLDNAVGLDDQSVLNPDGLRYRNEFAMHKILDAIGDLHLFGSTIQGRFEGYCSGHRMNKLLLDKLVASGSYEVLNVV
tara:strand:- start:1983 stop:2840 length:858 start_codon:yes stop_codon:yes gene_type:complete